MASIEPLIGVNLGGWLVLEPWMTPSLFMGTSAVDEYSFCHSARKDDLKRLKTFRDRFITEADIAWLAAKEVQAVRLPIGYWLFGDQEPYKGTYRYVDQLFTWATKHGMKVLLSLHGAPGSQNGEMHSGQSGAIEWPQAGHIDATLKVLRRIAKRYGQEPALYGISVLNEPHRSLPIKLLEIFYQQAETVVRPHLRHQAVVLFSDSFRPRAWRHRLRSQVADHHRYQLFTVLDRHCPAWLHLLRARTVLPFSLRDMSRHHHVVVGEWSLALPGRRPQAMYRRYGQAQLNGLRHADAWFYWSYKTEYGGPWSFQSMVEAGTLDMPTLE